MLASTRKETFIQSTLNHALKTDPGAFPRRRAFEDSSADTPGQARNGASRDADGQAVRGEPGSGRRHRGNGRDHESGESRVFVLGRQGVHAGRVAVRASGSFNVQTASGAVQGISRRHCGIVQG